MAQCDVMLKDIADSKRISTRIEDDAKGEYRKVHVLVGAITLHLFCSIVSGCSSMAVPIAQNARRRTWFFDLQCTSLSLSLSYF